MKLLLGIACIVFGIGLFIICYIFGFDLLIYKLLVIFLLINSLLIIYHGFKFISEYISYNRLVKRGIKVKATIVDIKRTLLGTNDFPCYVIEVFYEHPNDKKNYYTEFEYSDDLKINGTLKKGGEINILVDPRNPENIFYSKTI